MRDPSGKAQRGQDGGQLLGIVSDTHNLLRPEVAACLSEVDLILHAGDVGSEQVLLQLGAIAPVVAVRGNVDTDPWAEQLPLTTSVNLQGVLFYLIHDFNDLRRHPAPSGTGVIVHGHSHKPFQSEEKGICALNPGSAGPRRFSLPVSLVLARWEEGHWNFSFQDLTGRL